MAKKILLVEDDSTLVQALTYELQQEGFEVTVAGDGLAGLEAAEKVMPDLILLDINMPKMDGLTMLKKLRTSSWGKDVSVIMLTNYSDEQKVMEALAEQAFYYLVKSDWSLTQIVGKVKEKLVMVPEGK